MTRQTLILLLCTVVPCSTLHPLTSWASESGIAAPLLTFPATGNAATAQEPVDAKTLLLRVPHRLIISATTPVLDSAFEALRRSEPMMGRTTCDPPWGVFVDVS